MGENEITAEEIRGAIGTETDEATEEEGPETQGLETSEEGEKTEETESETEQTTESEEGEKESKETSEEQEQEENMIPQSEFDRRYSGWKTKEREYQDKIDLLRNDPEAYYQRYPDERPATPAAPGAGAAQAAGTGDGRIPAFSECLDLQVLQGPYQGYTLGQLWADQDPAIRAAAMDLYNTHRDFLAGQQAEAKAKQNDLKTSVQKEHDDFYEARSKELFGKDVGSLTDTEKGQIQGIVNDLLDQMEGLGVFRLEAAYKLATMDERIKSSQAESVKALIDGIRKGAKMSGPEVKKTGGGNGDVYDRLMDISEDALAAKLEDLSAGELEKFWKKAPQAFRAKHRQAADAWV